MSDVWGKAATFFAMCSMAGWLFLFVGIGSRRTQRRREEREHTRAVGRIADYVEVKPRPKSGAGVSHRAIIEFTADGQPFLREYENPMNPEQHPVGEEVDVLYDVSDPSRFHLDCDEAFSRGSGNAVRIGLIWIAASAALTLLLATAVGGLRIDFSELPRILRNPSRLFSRSAEPETGEADGFTYELQPDSTVHITGYRGNGQALTLPIALGGHVVSGFSGTPFAQAYGMTRLVVPGTYASVPPGMFIACVSLTEVELQDGVRSIGQVAFSACPALKDVTLPASLAFIADSAFPEDCAARFHVPADSEAERFCQRKGFSYTAAP